MRMSLNALRRAGAGLLIAVPLAAQAPSTGGARGGGTGVRLGTAAVISTDQPRAPHAESFLALNPTNPRNLLATSFAVEGGEMVSAVYATHDGGRTWQRARSAVGDTVLFSGGDAIVYFDRAGTAYFGSINGSPHGFMVARSADGGRTWGAPVTVPGGTYDRQYLAFDTTGGKYDGWLYAAGMISVRLAAGPQRSAIAIASSPDSGRTFSQARVITNGESKQYMSTIADLQVAPGGGEVVIPYLTGKGEPTDPTIEWQWWTISSDDGGKSFAVAHPGPKFTGLRGSVGSRVFGAPRAAMDLSNGPHRGRLFVVWTDYVQERHELRVAYSDDLGKTWSPPVRVNDDTTGNQPGNAALAINKDGVIGVVFNDRRDDLQAGCYRLAFSISVDGGDTFLPNQRIGAGPTCVHAPANWAPIVYSMLDSPLDVSKERPRRLISLTGIPSRFQNGGDTQGLVASPDGAFHLAWIDGSSGVMQLAYQQVQVERAGPRPSTLAAFEDVTAKVGVKVSAPVVDIVGRTLAFTATLTNEDVEPVRGPLTLVLEKLDQALPGTRATNADNGKSGAKAEWVFAVPGGVLAPGASTAARTLRFRFDEARDGPASTIYAKFGVRAPRAEEPAKASARAAATK